MAENKDAAVDLSDWQVAGSPFEGYELGEFWDRAAGFDRLPTVDYVWGFFKGAVGVFEKGRREIEGSVTLIAPIPKRWRWSIAYAATTSRQPPSDFGRKNLSDSYWPDRRRHGRERQPRPSI